MLLVLECKGDIKKEQSEPQKKQSEKETEVYNSASMYTQIMCCSYERC